MQIHEHDCVFSLGTNCEISYNLRSYFGELKSGLLDWFITPLAAVPDLLRSGFSLVDADFARTLEHMQVDNTDSVIHRPSGILLHHAFTRDEHHRIAARWSDEVEAVAQKYRFLGARMNETLANARRPLLFINRTGWYDPMDEVVLRKTHEPDIYLQIINAFRDRYPSADPVFCITNGHPEAVQRAVSRNDVRVASVANHGEWHEGAVDHYAGCKRGWKEALDSLLANRSMTTGAMA